MEIKQEKRKEANSPAQEQKESKLQVPGGAAEAERKGPSAGGESKSPNGSSLNGLEAPKGPTREQYQSELRASSMESKKTVIPESANKSKLKE